ncbi:MAG: DUF4139 domain-containing protein [candidate division WOR-3 bacterium]
MIFLFLLISYFSEVTFYPEGALITEKREVNLKKGVNTVNLKLLPIVDTLSLKIDFEDGELISTRFEKKVFNKYGDFLKVLQDSLDLINDTIEKLSVKIENLKKAGEFIESFKTSYSEKESKEFLEKEFISSNVINALNVIINKGTEIKNEINKINKKIKDLNFKKEEIQKKLSIYHPIGIEDLTLKVNLNSKIEGKSFLNLEYFLPSKCGYRLIYKINGLPEEKKVEMNLYSRIFQYTGKDFENVYVNLSTLSPRKYIEPVISRWIIGERFTRRKPTFKGMKATPGEVETIESGISEEHLEMEIPVEEKELYTSFEYRFPFKTTIPSDIKGVMLFMKKFEINSDFSYKVIPRSYKFGFLMAKGVLASKEILPRGTGNIFLEEEFIGKKDIGYIYPGDTLLFYFGEDPYVKVSYDLIKSEINKSGLFDKKIKREFGYSVKIKNERKTEIKGILIAEVPVSSDPDIVINNIEFSKKPFKEDKPEGKYYFEFKLKSGETYELQYYFDVIHPPEKQIFGL